MTVQSTGVFWKGRFYDSVSEARVHEFWENLGWEFERVEDNYLLQTGEGIRLDFTLYVPDPYGVCGFHQLPHEAIPEHPWYWRSRSTRHPLWVEYKPNDRELNTKAERLMQFAIEKRAPVLAIVGQPGEEHLYLWTFSTKYYYIGDDGSEVASEWSPHEPYESLRPLKLMKVSKSEPDYSHKPATSCYSETYLVVIKYIQPDAWKFWAKHFLHMSSDGELRQANRLNDIPGYARMIPLDAYPVANLSPWAVMKDSLRLSQAKRLCNELLRLRKRHEEERQDDYSALAHRHINEEWDLRERLGEIAYSEFQHLLENNPDASREDVYPGNKIYLRDLEARIRIAYSCSTKLWIK